MPPVASETTSIALIPTLPNPARAAQTSDVAQASPFATLLDIGTSAGGDQPPQTSATTSEQPSPTGIVEQFTPKLWSHSAQLPAAASDTVQVSNDAAQLGTDAAQPEGDTNSASIAAAFVATVGAGKTIGAVQPKTDVKTTASNAAGDDNKPAGDGKPPRDSKPAESSTPADPAAVAATNPIQPIIPLAAPTPGAPAPGAPDATSQPASDGLAQVVAAAIPQAAAVAQVAIAIVPKAISAVNGAATATLGAATPKTKPAKFDTAQADSNGPDVVSDSLLKTVSAPKGDDKPQAVVDDGNEQGAVRVHTDVAADAHHTTIAKTQAAAVQDAQPDPTKIVTDAAQQTTLTPSSAAASPAAANPATSAPPAAPVAVPLAGIAVEIAGKALAGKNRFEIRLDPPELGRIEVRLDVSHDGQVTSSLIADRSDTLDLLRRDASGLERALQDAGLKTGDNGLQFSLRDQSTGQNQGQSPSPAATRLVVSDDALPAIDTTSRGYGRLAGLGGGIDIRV